MTTQLVRDVLNEAQAKGQIGFFAWRSWPHYHYWATKFKPGNEYCDFVFSQVASHERTTLTFHWEGFYGPSIVGASVNKLISSDEEFREFLEACKINLVEGPITFVPSNELSSYCTE